MYKFYTVLSLSLQKSLTLLHYLQNRVWLSERVIMRIRWNNQVVPCIVLMVWIDWSLYLSLQTRIHCRIHRKVSLEMATDLKNRFHTNAIPKEDLWGIFIIKVVQTFHFINTLFNLVNAAFTSPEGTLSDASLNPHSKQTHQVNSTRSSSPLICKFRPRYSQDAEIIWKLCSDGEIAADDEEIRGGGVGRQEGREPRERLKAFQAHANLEAFP